MRLTVDSELSIVSIIVTTLTLVAIICVVVL